MPSDVPALARTVESFYHSLAASLTFIAIILLGRLLAVRALRRSGLTPEVKARWLNQIRAASLLLLLAGILVIWTEHLRGLALSIAAIAVAFVISMKELILCLHGAFLRTGSRAFSVGDRIQVAGIRGDVVETGALTTVLLEVGASSKQTGRSVVLPNSVFVEKPTYNESFLGEHGLFSLRVPVKDRDSREAERRLLDAARAECDGYVDLVRQHIEDVGWMKGVEPDSVEPSISLELPKTDQVDLILRYPAPTRQSGRVEQAILRRFVASTPDAVPAERSSEPASEA